MKLRGIVVLLLLGIVLSAFACAGPEATPTPTPVSYCTEEEAISAVYYHLYDMAETPEALEYLGAYMEFLTHRASYYEEQNGFEVFLEDRPDPHTIRYQAGWAYFCNDGRVMPSTSEAFELEAELMRLEGGG